MEKEILRLDNFGRGICYVDSKICFVEGAMPGEIVDLTVLSNHKNYLEGKVNSIIKKSNDRIVPKCLYCEQCGGCYLGHMNFSYENEFKLSKVKDVLEKFGNVSSDKVKDIVYLNSYYYRNKIVLHGDKNRFGLYEEKSNNIVPISKCLLVSNNMNKVISILNNISKYSFIKEAMIRESNDSKKIMVSISGNVREYDSLLNDVSVLVINDRIVKGDKSFISNIGNYKYYVSPKSFFQVNRELTKLLYDEVRSVVSKVKPSSVLDLYCGAGSISLYISDLVNKVVGVEVVEDAIRDANRNKELNGVSNVSFICSKVNDVIDNLSGADFIIVDPPRAGLDKKTIESIKKISPLNITYVSCNPVTLARDIKLLSDFYDTSYVRVFNMFPRTNHVECVCVLHRKAIEE